MVDGKKIGINGFGRIGRQIFRILLSNPDLIDMIVINDINPDKKNIAYQLKYDSLYGNLDANISCSENGIIMNGREIPVYHERKIDEVPWQKHGVQVVVDSSGNFENVSLARNLRSMDVKKVIITYSPKQETLIDRYVVMGANEETLEHSDFVISSSTCDSTALSPVAKILENAYGIEGGYLLTLHPPLQNQNLLDGVPPLDQTTTWTSQGTDHHYILGRASGISYLPKPTSTIDATSKIIKSLSEKLSKPMSFRVPENGASCTYLTATLNGNPTTESVRDLFLEFEKNQQLKIIKNEFGKLGPLASIDYKGSLFSANIDHRQTLVDNKNQLRLVFFYDNEFGYSSRVVDLIDYIYNIMKLNTIIEPRPPTNPELSLPSENNKS